MVNEYSTDVILSYKDLISKIPEAQIYEHYLQNSITFNKAYLSPIQRQDGSYEKTPSLRLRVINETIKWKDYGLGVYGSAVDLVMKMYNIPYFPALNKIYEEIKNDIKPELFQVNTQQHRSVVTHLKYSKGFKDYHLNYYRQGHITKELLTTYNVVVGKELIQNGRTWHKDSEQDPMFGYLFSTKNNVWSTYRPYAPEKTLKHRTNNIVQVIFGIKQLPDTGPRCLITSSMKDVLQNAVINIPAVASYGETVILPDEIVLGNLKKRFPVIGVLLNNDAAGFNALLKYIEYYNLYPIIIPQDYPKDPFDIVKNVNLATYAEFMQREFYKIDQFKTTKVYAG